MDLLVGLDVGTRSSCVAVVNGNLTDVIENNRGSKQTPNCIGFVNGLRVYGDDALDQNESNVGEIIDNFKPFIGGNFGEDTQPLFKNCQYSLSLESGRMLIKVTHNKENIILIPEQLLAMHLANLHRIIKNRFSRDPSHIVMSVPVFYSAKQRRALTDACEIAGVKCDALVNDTAAIATWYYIFNSSTSIIGEKERVVAFVSVGYMHTQVMICAFTKTTIRMLSTESDANLGGWHLDQIIYDKMRERYYDEFQTKIHPKSYAAVRLRNKCIELKTRLCLNPKEVQVRVDGMPQQKNLTISLSDSELEKYSTLLLDRLYNLCEQCLSSSEVKKEDLDAVELIGGSLCLPFMKRVVQKAFGQGENASVREKEVVAIGCAIHAVKLSPNKRTANFTIHGDEELTLSPNLTRAEIEVFKETERKLCSIDERTTKQMESINTAQMQLYEFMDRKDNKLNESELQIFTMVQEILDELERNTEYNEQFCNRIKEYAIDVYKKIPLFTDLRQKLYENWKNLVHAVWLWREDEENYLAKCSQLGANYSDIFIHLDALEESRKAVEESWKSIENHLHETRIKCNNLKEIKSSLSDQRLQKVLQLPNYDDVIHELESNVSESKQNHDQINSKIQGLKNRIESLNEESLRNELVPAPVLYQSPFHRLPEVRQYWCCGPVWKAILWLYWSMCYYCTRWNPRKRIPVSPVKNITDPMAYLTELTLYLSWNTFNKNKISKRLIGFTEYPGSNEILEWRSCEDKLAWEVESLTKMISVLGVSIRSHGITYWEVIEQIQRTLNFQLQVDSWNQQCLAHLHSLSPLPGATRDRWLLEQWIEYHNDIRHNLDGQRNYLQREETRIKQSLAGSDEFCRVVQFELNKLSMSKWNKALGSLCDQLSKTSLRMQSFTVGG